MLTIFKSFTALFKEIQRKMPQTKEKTLLDTAITGQQFIYFLKVSKKLLTATLWLID